MTNFLYLWFWWSLSLCVIGLIAFAVAQIMKRKTFADASLCFLSWTTLSFLFPYLAKSKGVIKSWWLSALLMLVSPAAIVTYYIVALLGFGISPYRFKDLKFTDKQSIELLTGLKDFPEFEIRTILSTIWTAPILSGLRSKKNQTTAFSKAWRH